MDLLALAQTRNLTMIPKFTDDLIKNTTTHTMQNKNTTIKWQYLETEDQKKAKRLYDYLRENENTYKAARQLNKTTISSQKIKTKPIIASHDVSEALAEIINGYNDH